MTAFTNGIHIDDFEVVGGDQEAYDPQFYLDENARLIKFFGMLAKESVHDVRQLVVTNQIKRHLEQRSETGDEFMHG
jgi:hypothetical protein